MRETDSYYAIWETRTTELQLIVLTDVEIQVILLYFLFLAWCLSLLRTLVENRYWLELLLL